MNQKYQKYYKNWILYEGVRRSGEFNMIMEAEDARKKAGISSPHDYADIVRKYSFVKNELSELCKENGLDIETVDLKDLKKLV